MAWGVDFEDCDQFAESLRSDRFIKIFVGDQTQPFLVSEVALTSSSEYFVKAIKNEQQLGSGELGTLRFPDDDEKVWKVLLYWVFMRSLPASRNSEDEDEQQILLVKVWAAAEKYMMRDVQDLVMVELLASMSVNGMDLEIIKLAFELTPPDCKLRMVTAEAVVKLMDWKHDEDEGDLAIFDGVTGFSTELMRAVNRGRDHIWRDRLDNYHDWQECMVAGGPEVHWIHETDC